LRRLKHCCRCHGDTCEHSSNATTGDHATHIKSYVVNSVRHVSPIRTLAREPVRSSNADLVITFAPLYPCKVAFALRDLLIVFVLLDILRSSGQRSHLVLAYAWNPLLAIEVAGSGHIDISAALTTRAQ